MGEMKPKVDPTWMKRGRIHYLKYAGQPNGKDIAAEIIKEDSGYEVYVVSPGPNNRSHRDAILWVHPSAKVGCFSNAVLLAENALRDAGYEFAAQSTQFEPLYRSEPGDALQGYTPPPWRPIENHLKWLAEQDGNCVIVTAVQTSKFGIVATVGTVKAKHRAIYPPCRLHPTGSPGLDPLHFTHWMPFVPPVDEG